MVWRHCLIAPCRLLAVGLEGRQVEGNPACVGLPVHSVVADPGPGIMAGLVPPDLRRHICTSSALVTGCHPWPFSGTPVFEGRARIGGLHEIFEEVDRHIQKIVVRIAAVQVELILHLRPSWSSRSTSSRSRGRACRGRPFIGLPGLLVPERLRTSLLAHRPLLPSTASSFCRTVSTTCPSGRRIMGRSRATYSLHGTSNALGSS
jgi:hypothetical protein